MGLMFSEILILCIFVRLWYMRTVGSIEGLSVEILARHGIVKNFPLKF
jgi:isoprenylcysteine carboxyl methyltransferase (ICMT) family protein YpbQ